MSILAKNSWKTEIELFPKGAISQKNYRLSEIFWPGLYFNQEVRFLHPLGIHIYGFNVMIMQVFLLPLQLRSCCTFPSLIVSRVEKTVAVKHLFHFFSLENAMIKTIRIYVRWMIKYNFLRLMFFSNLHKIVCRL